MSQLKALGTIIAGTVVGTVAGNMMETMAYETAIQSSRRHLDNGIIQLDVDDQSVISFFSASDLSLKATFLIGAKGSLQPEPRDFSFQHNLNGEFLKNVFAQACDIALNHRITASLFSNEPERRAEAFEKFAKQNCLPAFASNRN